MSKARWTAKATADLIAIGDYIAADKPEAARAWVEKLRKRATDAAATPLAGRIVPEFGCADLREVFVRSYRIVYRMIGDGIIVLTVFHGHRLLDEAVQSDAE
jgi:plasmid stabilization system protein ParE